jgi:hypothetical protein
MPTSLLSRLPSALPDAATAGFFLVLWIAPALLWEGALKTGMLIMLVEFVLIHASGLLGSMLLGNTLGTARRLGLLFGFGAFYLIFILGFAFAFKEWWPVFAFGWLLLGKAGIAFDRGLPNDDRRIRLQATWAAACLFYLLGVMLTLFLPIPRLGITHAVVSSAQLTGSGYWISHPQTVVAFGLIYFTALSAIKLLDWRLPSVPRSSVRYRR